MADDFRTTEVGGRYAQALFDLADETGALDAVRADLAEAGLAVVDETSAEEGGRMISTLTIGGAR